MGMSCARRLEGPGLRCEAYPEGSLPRSSSGEWDHHRPKPGDRGLRYTPVEGAEPMWWWPEEKK